MKKVLIIGIFDFIGFHLSNRLLEDGIEVLGVNVNQVEEDYEDKMLAVGRNANLELIEIEDLKHVEHANLQTIYIDLSCYKLDDSVFFTSLQMLKEVKCHTYVILSDYEKISYEKHENILKQIFSSLSFVWLPTVFGEWQPQSMVFSKIIQQSITGDTDEIKIREHIHDALYVKDVVESLINGTLNNYEEVTLLSKKDKNQWLIAIEQLLKELNISKPQFLKEFFLSSDTLSNSSYWSTLTNLKSYIQHTDTKQAIQNQIDFQRKKSRIDRDY